MVLDGVLLDERVVRDLATIVDMPLREKLLRALFFNAEVVSLSFQERVAVLAALDEATGAEEVHARLMDNYLWAKTRAGIS